MQSPSLNTYVMNRGERHDRRTRKYEDRRKAERERVKTRRTGGGCRGGAIFMLAGGLVQTGGFPDSFVFISFIYFFDTHS